MSLKALQAEFQAYVRDATGDENGFAAYLTTPRGGDASRRMHVYHHAYRARLGQVLREVFDKTWSYVGDEGFALALESYLVSHASRSPSLDDYGAAFPVHLAELWPGEPDVTELAWLDWSMRRVFDGEDAVPAEFDVLSELAGGAWDHAGFVLHPTLALRGVTTNVGALWSSFDQGAPLAPAPLDAPMAVRVWRKGLQPHFRMIDVIEAGALRDLVQGRSFAEVCDRLTRDGVDEPVDRAAALLAVWFHDELVVGLTNV